MSWSAPAVTANPESIRAKRLQYFNSTSCNDSLNEPQSDHLLANRGSDDAVPGRPDSNVAHVSPSTVDSSASFGDIEDFELREAIRLSLLQP